MAFIVCNNFMRDMAKVAMVALTATILAHGQNESGTAGVNFQGRVLYQNNTPAQFVQVELWADGETTWRTRVTTDRMGKFQTGAPCMVIQYKVEVVGFHPSSGRIDISTPPCRALESITLRALPGTAIPTIDAPQAVTIDPRIAAIPEAARTEFDLGQKALKNNDFVAAAPHLQKAITLYPMYAEAYQLLGVAQLNSNQGPQAEASLVRALQIEERMPQAQYLLGVLYAMTGRANLAEKPLSRFADLDPQNPDAHFELAKVCFALNKFTDAEMHARRSIELKEKDAGVHIVLGYALLRQKRPEDARQSFQQFLNLNAGSPMASDIKNVMSAIDEQKNK